MTRTRSQIPQQPAVSGAADSATDSEGRQISGRFREIAGGPAVALLRAMIPGTQELQRRTRKFFLRVLRVCERLPKSPATNRIAGQLKDAAEGADTRYRAACRGASLDEFIRTVGLASDAMEQAHGWLRTLHSVGFGNQAEKRDLMHEARMLVRAYEDAQKTARGLLAKTSGLRARNERF